MQIGMTASSIRLTLRFAHRVEPRSRDGAAQQRKKAAAGRHAQQVKDGDQKRERYARAEAQEGQRDDLKILYRKNARRDHEQRDHDNVKHRMQPSSVRKNELCGSVGRRSIYDAGAKMSMRTFR